MKTMKRSKMVNDEAKIKQHRRALYWEPDIIFPCWRRGGGGVNTRVDRDDLNQWYIDTQPEL